jgi:hypothetical protein
VKACEKLKIFCLFLFLLGNNGESCLSVAKYDAENVDERPETTKNLNDATSMPRVATMVAMLPLHSLSLGFIIFGSFCPNLCSMFNRFQDNENEPYCRSLSSIKNTLYLVCHMPINVRPPLLLSNNGCNNIQDAL